MDLATLALLFFVIASATGWALAWLLLGRWRAERTRARALDAGKRSQSTKYGNLTEQFAPWMARWPFDDPGGFRFLGKPVDGVQFERDAVYFVEIKAAGSELSPEQRALREAVLAGRVGWVTFRTREGATPEVARPWETRAPSARP